MQQVNLRRHYQDTETKLVEALEIVFRKWKRLYNSASARNNRRYMYCICM